MVDENKNPGGQPEQSQQATSPNPVETKPKRARGLAAADPETRRAVARKGGEAVSRNKKHMAEIGKKGGEAVSQDRRHMASIGRKGGEAVSQNREHMAEIGRKAWKEETRYHRRSLAETGMYRYKTIIGPGLKARTLENQKAEAAIAVRCLNRYTALGMPHSLRIA